MSDTKQVKLEGGYINIEPEGHVNAYITKAKEWRHFSADKHENPIMAGMAWVSFFKDCVTSNRR